MKISRWTLLWLLVVGLLISIELAIVVGAVNPYDVVTFFFIMVSGLIVISRPSTCAAASRAIPSRARARNAIASEFVSGSGCTLTRGRRLRVP